MNFAQNLKFLMDYHGLTKYRLAKDLSISQTTIANWLELKNEPHPNMSNVIASKFQISVEDLTDRDLQSEGLGSIESNKKSPATNEGDKATIEVNKELLDIWANASPEDRQLLLDMARAIKNRRESK